MSNTGVVIGRFQVPYLHAGHLNLIATALRENDKVLILVGCEMEGVHDEKRNPYTFYQICEMIECIFPQVYVEALFDRNDDYLWSEQVDYICSDYTSPILYHSRDSFKDHYKSSLPLREVDEIPGISGTKLRESLNNV